MNVLEAFAKYQALTVTDPPGAEDLMRRVPAIGDVLASLPRNPILGYAPFDTDSGFMPDGNRKSSPLKFHMDLSKIRVAVTGNRCSKTYSGAAEAIAACLGIDPVTKMPSARFRPPCDVWVVSDTEDSSREICQRTYYDLIPQDMLADESLYTAKNGWKGNSVLFSNGSHITFRFSSQGRETFQGTYRHIIHMDEEQPKDIYQECLARTTPVGGRPRGEIIITFTPIFNEKIGISWVHTDLYARRAEIPGINFHFWGLQDVPNSIIPADEKKVMIASYEADEREARIYGMFTPIGIQLAFPRTLIAQQRRNEREPEFIDLEYEEKKRIIPIRGVKYLPEGVAPPTAEETYKAIIAIPQEHGLLRVYDRPVAGHRYVLGADPAQGLADGDDSCLQILERDTLSVCAEYFGKLEPDEFGALIDMAGRWYNYAYVGVENVADLTPIYYLKNEDYPNLHYQCIIDGRPYDKTTDKIGWNTNTKTRRMLRNDALMVLRDGSASICSGPLLDQMEVFARNRRGRWEAIAGSHDDLVFAWMIAIQMLQWADVTDDFREDGYVDPLTDAEEELDLSEVDFSDSRLRSRIPVKDNEERLARKLKQKEFSNIGGLV